MFTLVQLFGGIIGTALLYYLNLLQHSLFEDIFLFLFVTYPVMLLIKTKNRPDRASKEAENTL